MYIVLIGIAAISRILQLFNWYTDEAMYVSLAAQSYQNLVDSTYLLYGLGVIAVFGLTSVLAVTRFYKNLFTGEGYLSFTLPVTPTQHILVKAAVATLAQIASFIAFCVSFAVITAGEYLVETFKGIAYEFARMWGDLGANMPFFVLYVLILIVVYTVCQLMLIYGCIAIGQMTNKNRVLAAVGVYFAHYAATQVLSSIGIVFLAVFADSFIGEAIGNFIVAYPTLSIHLGFMLAIIIVALITFAYFTVTRIVIKKRLNLE